MNTLQKLELNNGEVVELTLTFARLIKVKNHNKKLYEELKKLSKDTSIPISRLLDKAIKMLLDSYTKG